MLNVIAYLGTFLFIVVSTTDEKRVIQQEVKEVRQLGLSINTNFPDYKRQIGHDELMLLIARDAERQVKLDEKK